MQGITSLSMAAAGSDGIFEILRQVLTVMPAAAIGLLNQAGFQQQGFSQGSSFHTGKGTAVMAGMIPQHMARCATPGMVTSIAVPATADTQLLRSQLPGLPDEYVGQREEAVHIVTSLQRRGSRALRLLSGAGIGKISLATEVCV